MKELLKKKNVVAVVKGHKFIGGVDTGRDAIVVYVTKKVPLSELSKADIVPKKIRGLESDVKISGEIRALAVDRTTKWRPAPGGVSIGHPDITAGTLGMVVKKNGVRHILSNNHVLANCNDANIGDQTWQPGKADGGVSIDIIGHLTNFVPIGFISESSCPIWRLIIRGLNKVAGWLGSSSSLHAVSTPINKVDCALSTPIDDEDISDEILEIGKAAGFNLEVKVDDAVKKSGRTTGVNHGTVIGVEGVANVGYGDKIAMFEDQIVTTPIAQGGDSGSMVLNENDEVIGHLFAGSDTLTIVNKIANTIEALGLDR
jgi:hypothetical protein